jgi:hypothetical protein
VILDNLEGNMADFEREKIIDFYVYHYIAWNTMHGIVQKERTSKHWLPLNRPSQN